MSKKSVIIIFTLVVIIILLFSLLVYYWNTVKNINTTQPQFSQFSQNTENIMEVVKTSSEEAKLSPNAMITFFKHFSGCGHVIKLKENISENMANMSKDEFSSLYNDWEINKFTSTEVELYKNFSGNCGEHFLVKSNPNGFIDIYNVQSDGSLVLHEKTEIAVKYLSDEDIEELEYGIYLYGKDNLNAYIENFE